MTDTEVKLLLENSELKQQILLRNETDLKEEIRLLREEIADIKSDLWIDDGISTLQEELDEANDEIVALEKKISDLEDDIEKMIFAPSFEYKQQEQLYHRLLIAIYKIPTQLEDLLDKHLIY